MYVLGNMYQHSVAMKTGLSYELTFQHFSSKYAYSGVIFHYISNKMQRYTVYYMWKVLYMFRVVPRPIIRSAYNCIYSIWYLSHRYCSLPL